MRAACASDTPIGVAKRGVPFRKPHVTGERDGEERGEGVRLLGSQGMLPPPPKEGRRGREREDGVTWC